jgi:hypothetical protein
VKHDGQGTPATGLFFKVPTEVFTLSFHAIVASCHELAFVGFVIIFSVFCMSSFVLKAKQYFLEFAYMVD